MGPNQIDVNNLNLTSNNGNVELVNQQVNVAQNMNVKADDFIVRAGKSTFESENSSRSSGAGISFNPLAPITPANFTPSVNYSQSNGNMQGTTYNNSHITVGGNTTINTTGDMILSGADLVTNTIDGNIGGQLIIESLQDTVTGSNSGFGGNISLPTVAGKRNAETGKDTPAHRSPTVGGSVTDGSVEKAWTSDQSSLIAKNGGTINVGSTTTVTGAVVASENVDKPLIINTTELITKNLEDSNESTNTTIGFSGISESTPVPKTQYTYDNTDKEQSTLATMSNVVVNTGSGQVDLASKGINTDISKAQEVTKDEETHIDITIPTDLLNEKIRKEFIEELKETLATPGDVIEAIARASEDGLTFFGEIQTVFSESNRDISIDVNKLHEKAKEELLKSIKEVVVVDENGTETKEKVATEDTYLYASSYLKTGLASYGKGDYDVVYYSGNATDKGKAKESFALVDDKNKKVYVNLDYVDISNPDDLEYVLRHEGAHDTYKNKTSDELGATLSGITAGNLSENGIKYFGNSPRIVLGNNEINIVDTDSMDSGILDVGRAIVSKISIAKAVKYITNSKYRKKVNEVLKKEYKKPDKLTPIVKDLQKNPVIKKGVAVAKAKAKELYKIVDKELISEETKKKTRDTLRQNLVTELASKDCNGKCRKDLQLTQEAEFKAFGKRLSCESGSKDCDPEATGFDELIVFSTDKEMYEYAKNLSAAEIRKNYKITSQETIDRDFNKLSNSEQKDVRYGRVKAKMYQFESNADELYKSGQISSEDLSAYNSTQNYVDNVQYLGKLERDVANPIFNSISAGIAANGTYKVGENNVTSVKSINTNAAIEDSVTSGKATLKGNAVTVPKTIAEDPIGYYDAPKTDGTLNIGAGKNPIKGAYNIDLNDSANGVYYGDANDLSNIETGSQSKVIIQNPYKFDPLNPEIIRVTKSGGIIEITGSLRNGSLNNLSDPLFLENNGLIKIKSEIIDSAGYNYTDGRPFVPGNELMKYTIKKE